MKKLLLLFSGTFSFLIVTGQTAQEALVYSRLNSQSTARSIGFGNALGSVGGDFATLGINPAGIGVYRSSEMVFTPALKFGGATSGFQNEKSDDNYINFGINNFGIVATRNYTGSQRKWKTFSFGFGLNRLADFNRRATYSGLNNQSSQSELFSYDANQYYNEFASTGNFDSRSPAYLGYNSFLIDTFGLNGSFISMVDYTQGIRQRKTLSERGGISELSFTFGGNYQEKLMLGATIGVPLLNYRSEAVFEERDVNNAQGDFQEYTHTETLKTTGSGINAKLGAIYVASDAIRLGVAVHTPTLLNISESFDASILANTENFGGIQEAIAQTSEFEYNFISPFRAIVSATAIIGKRGFVTADYEWVNHAAARYQLNTYDNEQIFGAGAFTDWQNALNNEIRGLYKSASHVRLGGEIRMDRIMLRAGAGWAGSPYRQAESFSTARVDLNAGIGYRGNRAFVDLGFMHSNLHQPDIAYSIPYSNGIIQAPKAELNYSLNTLALTVGFKF